MVGVLKPVNIVNQAVSRLNNDTFPWQQQLACHGADYQLGTLSWSDYISELVDTFVDVDHEQKLHQKLSFLKQQTNTAIYTKQFKQIVLELGEQALDDAALLFMFTEGLKAEIQMLVLLERPQVLLEAEQVAQRADVDLFLSGNRP